VVIASVIIVIAVSIRELAKWLDIAENGWKRKNSLPNQQGTLRN
jgi:hypothetical protein